MTIMAMGVLLHWTQAEFWTRGTSKPWASAGASKQGRILEGQLRQSLPLKPWRSLPPKSIDLSQKCCEVYFILK